MKTSATGGNDEILTAAQMQALEKQAMASGMVTGIALMERAGEGVLQAISRQWPDVLAAPGRACILCGPGNNGGDGYVIARLLQGQGWAVTVVALGATDRLPPDAQTNHDRWTARGEVMPWPEAASAMEGADLVIDAVFGIGLTRPLSPAVARVMDQVPRKARRVSVDVPSGILADGQTLTRDAAFPAELAVTFHCRKPVHVALADSGMAVAIADIGL
ncbi:NAD(P)H-hydrate epimerase [Fluviibacterium sp. DFM31]|uniref:NAD(P)H-hydrate epimerase n=1 Tax=Meridianimarinicoccus marinus TaxID=3231483 RepID=A0ABV3L3H4_9RHOB